jgi:hypothetical protein
MNKCKIIVRNKKVNDLNDRTKTICCLLQLAILTMSFGFRYFFCFVQGLELCNFFAARFKGIQNH